jgi:translation initiation factor IF-1
LVIFFLPRFLVKVLLFQGYHRFEFYGIFQILPTLRDAHRRLLSADATVIPSAASVSAVLVQSSYLAAKQTFSPHKFAYSVRHFHCIDHTCTLCGSANNGSFSALRALEVECSSTSHEPMQVYADVLAASNLATPMCPTFSALDFDFTNSAKLTCERTVNITAHTSGLIDAVVMWWSTNLDRSGEIVLSTKPHLFAVEGGSEKILDRDHWRQAALVLKNPVRVNSGDVITVHCSHHDLYPVFRVSVPTSSSDSRFVKRTTVSGGISFVFRIHAQK